MNHFFDVDIAVKHGLAEAILIENFRFWISKNKANKKHFHEGRYWTYNSAKAFAELFPYFSEDKIQRTLKKMETDGLLLTANYNMNPYDRTKWYSLPDFLSAEVTPPFREIAESSITDKKPYNSTSETVLQKHDLFEEFWKAYPRKLNKGGAKKAFAKLKVDRQLLDKMLEALEQQKQSEQWKNPKYIPHAQSWLNGERWEDEEGSIGFNSDYEKLRLL